MPYPIPRLSHKTFYSDPCKCSPYTPFHSIGILVQWCSKKSMRFSPREGVRISHHPAPSLLEISKKISEDPVPTRPPCARGYKVPPRLRWRGVGGGGFLFPLS